MLFCTKCGKQLNADSKFCNNCGAPVSIGTNKKSSFVEGELHKCHCGAILKSFETKCPLCGTELRGVNASASIKNFLNKLENAISEKQQITIIRNFPIPNTKEDILEFLTLAASNFDPNYYVTHLYEEDITDAWLAKINQCYEKAKICLENESDLQKATELYEKIQNQIQTTKNECTQQINAFEFKHSKLKFIILGLLGVSLILALIAFLNNRLISGMISVAMIFCSSLCLLLWLNIIKTKRSFWCIIVTIFAFTLIIPYCVQFSNDWNVGDLNPNTIKINISSDQMIGNTLSQTQSQLKSQGFSDIQTIELPWSQHQTSGTVVEISINGKKDFTENDRFLKSDPVIITYIGEPSLISVGFNPTDLIGLPYTDVKKKLEKSGFVNFEYVEKPWDPEKEPLLVTNISINDNDNFSAESQILQNETIVLTYYKNPQMIYLDKKIDDLLGQDSEAVKNYFLSSGFVYVELIEDNWNLFHKSKTVKSIKVNGLDNIDKANSFMQDAKIEIYYYK